MVTLIFDKDERKTLNFDNAGGAFALKANLSRIKEMTVASNATSWSTSSNTNSDKPVKNPNHCEE